MHLADLTLGLDDDLDVEIARLSTRPIHRRLQQILNPGRRRELPLIASSAKTSTTCHPLVGAELAADPKDRTIKL